MFYSGWAKYSPDSYGMGEYYNYELGVAVPVKNCSPLKPAMAGTSLKTSLKRAV